MFDCCLWFSLKVLSSEDRQDILKSSPVYLFDVPKCLECPFQKGWMKKVDFHLLWYLTLHFNQGVEEVLEYLKHLTFSVDCHGGCVDLLSVWKVSGCWAVDRFCILVDPSASRLIGSCNVVVEECSRAARVVSNESLGRDYVDSVPFANGLGLWEI